MKNKVLKNVVLSLCILGLVLFPVTLIYAGEYTFNSYSSFMNEVNSSIVFTPANNNTSVLFISSIPNEFTALYNSTISNFSIDIGQIYLIEFSKTSSYLGIAIGVADNDIDHSYLHRYQNDQYTPVLYSYFPQGTTYKLYRAEMKLSNYNISYYTVSNLAQVTAPYNNSLNTTGAFAGFYCPADHFSVSPNSSYADYYILDVQNVPGLPGAPYNVFVNPLVPVDPDTIHSSEVPFYYNIVQACINSSDYDPNDTWSFYRITTGMFPYMWEYYQRWYYNTHFGYMEDIVSNLQEMVTMSDNLQDIADRLALAFPDDQAELNDSIAETLLNDTNNTGLTAEKVSNAKSDFDEGVSMYQIDTSQSQYSTPFSAIRSGDWSFWSSTTLNNLGSGYQYTYTPQTRSSKKASNDDDDIYESNQKSLFDLLGW